MSTLTGRFLAGLGGGLVGGGREGGHCMRLRTGRFLSATDGGPA